VGLALIGFVHFVPVGDYEAPIRDIYAVYGSPAAGLFALFVLAGLVTSVALLGDNGARRVEGSERRISDAGEDDGFRKPAGGSWRLVTGAPA